MNINKMSLYLSLLLREYVNEITQQLCFTFPYFIVNIIVEYTFFSFSISKSLTQFFSTSAKFSQHLTIKQDFSYQDEHIHEVY